MTNSSLRRRIKHIEGGRFRKLLVVTQDVTLDDAGIDAALGKFGFKRLPSDTVTCVKIQSQGGRPDPALLYCMEPPGSALLRAPRTAQS